MLHQLGSGHFGRLVEWLKLDVLGPKSFVGERSLERVEVVRANGNERTLAAHVLVQFFLKIDERLVRLLGKGDVSQHGRDDKRTDRARLQQKGWRKKLRTNTFSSPPPPPIGTSGLT